VTTHRPLGRRRPTDFNHVEKYPLSALRSSEQPKAVPAVAGTNWYTAFDTPKQVRVASGVLIWVVGADGNLGSVRGGHCYALKPPKLGDPVSWWEFYDQGQEGACVGYGCSRMMSLLNRKRYDAQWLYHEAQLADEYSDTPPGEGTSVRAGLGILQAKGHVVSRAGKDLPVSLAEGIAAYRWATTVDEVRAVLQVPESSPLIPFENSWGRSGYPHTTHIPDDVFARLLAEEGECGLVTDR
jgi:hypothetical protein